MSEPGGGKAAVVDKHDRLSRALALAAAGRITMSDLAALVRSASVRMGYQAISVSSQEIINSDAWRLAHCAVESTDGQWNVRALPWGPDWAAGELDGPDAAPSRRDRRAGSTEMSGDPFLAVASGGRFSTYRTAGQRAGVRTVLGTRPGATILIILPTGSGKSAVMSVPAFFARPAASMVIVPTVSLAIDLASRLEEAYSLDHPIAYHSGLDETGRSAVRARLRNGDQWVVVTSPESACGSLEPTLTGLATAGRLRYLMIDEAHMVASWGSAFRPEFQALAGLRRRLRDLATGAQSGLTTVLLTGTLDQYALGVLEALFTDDTMTVVTSQATRPEPSYWHRAVPDDAAKRELLVDAVRHAPRPVLIYVSLVNAGANPQAVTAIDVAGWLREAGFNRLRVVTSATSTRERQATVDGLRCAGSPNDDCDIVVASSAFGLGIDIEDVRTVIHATVPESLDRYYQEVGRTGRDGRASLSLVIHAPNDRSVAEGLAAPNEIGRETAWRRWEAMRATSNPGPDGTMAVDLAAAHAGIFNPQGDLNRGWNLHTLAMMERVSMIRIHWMDGPVIDADASLESVNKAYRSRRLNVEVLHGNLADRSAFDQLWTEHKQLGIESAKRSVNAMIAQLGSSITCLNQTFADNYRLRLPSGNVASCETLCGGCPRCREHHQAPSTDAPLRHPFVDRPQPVLIGRSLSDAISGAGLVSITLPRDVSLAKIGDLLRALRSQNVTHLVLPGTRQLTEFIGRRPLGGWTAVDRFSEWLGNDTNLGLPQMILLPDDISAETVGIVCTRRATHAPTILIHGTETPGPPESKTALWDHAGSSTTMNKILTLI